MDAVGLLVTLAGVAILPLVHTHRMNTTGRKTVSSMTFLAFSVII